MIINIMLTVYLGLWVSLIMYNNLKNKTKIFSFEKREYT